MPQVISAAELSPADRAALRAALRNGDAHGLPTAARKLLEELLSAAEAGDQLIAVRDSQLLTTAQAAKIIGVPRERVAQMIERGGLTATEVDGHHRVVLADVLARKRRLDALEELRVMSYTEGFPMVWTPEDHKNARS